MRRWGRAPRARQHPSRGPTGGSAIDTLFLLVMFVAIAIFTIVIIARLLMRRSEERKRWEAEGRPEPPPRTPEQREQDRKTAITWGCLALAVPVVLVLLYAVSR